MFVFCMLSNKSINGWGKKVYIYIYRYIHTNIQHMYTNYSHGGHGAHGPIQQSWDKVKFICCLAEQLKGIWGFPDSDFSVQEVGLKLWVKTLKEKCEITIFGFISCVWWVFLNIQNNFPQCGKYRNVWTRLIFYDSKHFHLEIRCTQHRRCS